FFQAEDGIRDFHVTGVQTCALPIWQKTPNGGNRRLIGNEARGEDQPGLLAVQLGKFLLQLDQRMVVSGDVTRAAGAGAHAACRLDRKSTRLNSSHVKISYAVFCLKK